MITKKKSGTSAYEKPTLTIFQIEMETSIAAGSSISPAATPTVDNWKDTDPVSSDFDM